MLFLIATAWVVIVTGLLVRAVIQYQHYQTLTPVAWARETIAPSVTVIIPARNEAHNIARCLKGLLSQDYPADRWSGIVVNDNSTDSTASVVRQLAAAHKHIQLIDGLPLPEGWAGKPHACWQAASTSDAEWLCFVDADTVANSSLLSTAIAAAEERGLDMLSLEPYQELGSFWERVIIPAGFFLLAFQQDLRRVNNPETAAAVANGQFILVRRAAYEAVGGHAGVRAEICEDSALALAIKRGGKKLALLGAEKLIRTRMYTNLPAIWEGLSKNVVEMLGGGRVTALVALAALGLGIGSVLLPVAAWRHVLAMPHTWHQLGACLAISMASLALLGSHISGALYFGIPFWYGFLFPVGYCSGALIALNSVQLRWRGKVAWKGRVYRPLVP